MNLIGTLLVSKIGRGVMQSNTPNEEGERGVIVMTASVAAFDGQIGQVAVLRFQGRRRRHDAADGARPVGELASA